MSQDITTEEREKSGAKMEIDPPLSPTVDSTFAESTVISTQEGEDEEEQGSEARPVPTPHKRVFVPNWSNIIACLLFLILVGEHGVPLVWTTLESSLHPKAVVTLFAAKQRFQFTYSFLAVTGTADTSQHQIPSLLVSFTTPTKTEPIKTTGIGYTPAVQAKGEVTFYNEAPYSQTIAAGTVLTGSDGVQVLTDETASIRAGNGGTNGSATVSAHAVVGGTGGNIAPLEMNGLCCLAGILAQNTVAFTGGRDPQAYPTVSKADLAAAAKSLAGLLDPVARNGLQSQIAETERLLTPVQCTYATSSTPKVGEMATAASVTVSETCQTQVIDYAVLQAHTRLLFLHDAGKHLDRHFIQSGSPAVTLEKTTLLDQNHATYQLLVSASGTMIFHLSETELHTLVTQIAGRRIAQAQQELLQVQGVQGVSIQPAHQGDVALPTDSNQIHIVVS